MRWRSTAPVFVAMAATVGGCQGESPTYSVVPTSNCLYASGVRVIWSEGASEADPFATSGGSLLARGAYDVTIRFAKGASEAEAVAENLEDHEFLDPFEGREYRFVVRRKSNAVVSARVPKDEDLTSDVSEVLDAAERCLRAGANPS